MRRLDAGPRLLACPSSTPRFPERGATGVMDGFALARRFAGLLLVALAACGPGDNAQKPAPPPPAHVAEANQDNSPTDRLEDAANIDGDRIIHADDSPGDWLVAWPN